MSMAREAIAIRTDTINVPAAHEHIIALKLDDASMLSVGEVVEAIQGGERLHMDDAPIHVHSCPRCGAYPYLTVPAPDRLGMQ